MNSSDSVSLSLSLLTFFRRQELRELRLLQKEEHRNQAQLNTKHQLQLEQMLRRFEQEMTVSGQGELLAVSCFDFSSWQTLSQGSAVWVVAEQLRSPSGMGCICGGWSLLWVIRALGMLTAIAERGRGRVVQEFPSLVVFSCMSVYCYCERRFVALLY